jgi:hypothetical protein
MMFEVLLDVMDRLPRNTNAECANALLPSKVRGLERFDETKPMILPLLTERLSQRPIS